MGGFGKGEWQEGQYEDNRPLCVLQAGEAVLGAQV